MAVPDAGALRRDARPARPVDLDPPDERGAPSAGRMRGRAALSLLPGLLGAVLLQLASPAAQRVPVGPARFDLAVAWLAGEPGALIGAAWQPALVGRLQLGLLLRLAQAVQGGSVLSAAQLALLAVAALQVVLLWLLLRRLGLGAVPVGLAVAVFGVAPAAVVAHAGVSTAGIAVVWLLAAALLVDRRGAVGPALAAAAAVLAVASFPLAAVPAAAGAVAARRHLRTRPAVIGGVAAVLVVTGAGAIAAALPATAAARALNAVGAAQPLASGGASALTTWATTDPLGLLLAAVALGAVAARHRWSAVAAVVLALASLWPAGADAVGPLVLLLPLAAVAVAHAVARAVVALLQPVFRRSLVGSGWLMGVGGLLLVAVVVGLTGLTALVPGADRPVARAERWLSGSVPAGQVVLVGLGAWPDLHAASPATVAWYVTRQGSASVASSAAWSDADYVVSDPALDGSRAGAVRSALARSVAVARFGRGADELTVRAVREPAATPSPSPSASPSTAVGRRAQQARVSAGQQLAGNARIELSGQDRTLLTGGEVDQRIALVLAQFATAHRIRVASFGTAPGDASGVRTTVLISAVDGRAVPADVQRTGDLLRFLSALRDDFATRSIDATEDGVIASFTPDPDFVPSS